MGGEPLRWVEPLAELEADVDGVPDDSARREQITRLVAQINARLLHPEPVPATSGINPLVADVRAVRQAAGVSGPDLTDDDVPF